MATSHTSTGTVATGETTAETITAAIEGSMESNTGVKRVEVDGQVVEYDRQTGMKERSALRRETARADGTRPTVATIDLSGGP